METFTQRQVLALAIINFGVAVDVTECMSQKLIDTIEANKELCLSLADELSPVVGHMEMAELFQALLDQYKSLAAN